MRKEVWKDIDGFDNYQVSTNGQIKNKRTQKIINGSLDKYGYLRTRIKGNDGKSHDKYMHRVVAETFIENPEGKPTVDHISRNRTDNSIENLRWATMKEQNLNKGKANREKHPIIQKLDDNEKIIGEYITYAEAVRSEIEPDDTRSISSLADKIKLVCEGNCRKTAIGRKWRYKA